MQQRRRSLMRFIPFSRLHQAQREEDDTDLLANTMAPVQPAGYGTPNTGDPAEVVAEREAIQRTLAQIPEALRTPLLLSIVGGFSTSEIAALLGVGEAAVRQRLSRGRQQFRSLYTAESGDTLVNDVATTVAPGRERRMPARAPLSFSRSY
jgi:DNA-directed RNA polymerase specialized sigma24 family protein